VLLVFSGRPLVLDWAQKHVSAIMEAWFPGTEAGHAIATYSNGDVSPSGKLPMSFPRAVGQEPALLQPVSNRASGYRPGFVQAPGGDSRFFSRFIDVPNSALFPFGYGLSYSTFAYRDVKVSKTSIPLAQALANRSTPFVEATANRHEHRKPHSDRGWCNATCATWAQASSSRCAAWRDLSV